MANPQHVALLKKGHRTWNRWRKGLDLTGWLDFWRRPRFDRDQIRAYQDMRVRRLVEHAWHRIPYYHRLMEATGLRSADIRTRATR